MKSRRRMRITWTVNVSIQEGACTDGLRTVTSRNIVCGARRNSRRCTSSNSRLLNTVGKASEVLPMSYLILPLRVSFERRLALVGSIPSLLLFSFGFALAGDATDAVSINPAVTAQCDATNCPQESVRQADFAALYATAYRTLSIAPRGDDSLAANTATQESDLISETSLSFLTQIARRSATVTRRSGSMLRRDLSIAALLVEPWSRALRHA